MNGAELLEQRHELSALKGAELERRIAEELLEAIAPRRSSRRPNRDLFKFAPRSPIAEGASSPRESLPVDDIARREDRGQ